MSYKEDIAMRLTATRPELCVAFAARVALRSLPLLAVKEKNHEPFWYWKESKKSEHLLNLMLALRVSIASFSLVGIKVKPSDHLISGKIL